MASASRLKLLGLAAPQGMSPWSIFRQVRQVRLAQSGLRQSSVVEVSSASMRTA